MQNLEQKNFKFEIGNGKIDFNIGEVAKQSAGSILINYGNTDFLVTVATKKLEEKKDFLPLIINYEEKIYSIGEIPGNYLRRESRPSEKATLSARLIDRPLRPLFPKTFDSEIQIVITILGYDKDYESEMLSITGASLASVMAGLPLKQLVSGITIGSKDNEYIVNPNFDERQQLDFELKAAGTIDALNMIELKGNEIKEEEVLNALEFAHEQIKKLIEFQKEILNHYKIDIVEYIEKELYSDENYNLINTKFGKNIEDTLRACTDRALRDEELKKIKLSILDMVEIQTQFENEEYEKQINSIFDRIVKERFVKLIVNDKYRLDGRKVDEIRHLSSRIDVLQMVHGSSLFTRGETQSLATCTLGIKKDEQILDGLEDEKQKHFLLHYNFPPYSVGETGRIGAPGRREIGHGNLAEKALLPILPNVEEFPYTIRVVSEILESNGSSSQATICAGTLALMAAGVPIKKPVAGIAMGLIESGDDFTILSDIAGLEDHLGDMDFKVAGTRDGITAIQMDIKISGINRSIFEKCLFQAKKGREEILDHMQTVIDIPRTKLHKLAPKVNVFKIDTGKIKNVIGKGGETINKIIEQTGVKIDIDDEGLVTIYSNDQDKGQEAENIIKKIAKVYAVGEKYEAEIKRVEKYGMFVKFDGKQDALLHISDIIKDKDEKIEDKNLIGQKINIKIKSIDENSRIKVEMDKNNI